MRGAEGRSKVVAALVAAMILVACNVRPPAHDRSPTSSATAPVSPTTADESWPSFRGPRASGIADGQGLPESWNGETGENVRWKRAIAGLAHSSPVIWGDRIFVTSAVSSRGSATFKPGLYGSGDASEDRSEHHWLVIALDRLTGEILWERTAHTGVPRDKRHVKATYANSTPATDGRHVVALFGSEGLFAYDVDGSFLWKKDLGRLDAGAYDLPEYEWGSASSPILHDDRVFVQCDTQGESFVLAAEIESGKTVWKQIRDEPPAWGTPTIFSGTDGDVLVTNASNFIRGYDPRSGVELWRLGGSSRITAPTPVPAGDLVVVASGRAPERPIFAIRHGATGTITLGDGERSNEWVAWSWTGRGSYMPTPLVYRGYVYVLGNQGIFDCYELESGREVYRERIPHAGSGFSASPVAADGKIYLPGEDGEIFVVRAGPEFEIVATNPIPELVMATPAIAGGALYVRGQHQLYAIGR